MEISQKNGRALRSRSSRRTARENYFDLDPDSSNDKSQISMDDHDTPMMEKLPTMGYDRHLRQSVRRLDEQGVFERLQRDVGFQSSSVKNQKEHLAVLLANKQGRHHSGQDGDVMEQLHRQVFSNYTQWCKFLRIQPEWIGSQEHQVALFFLIWGEAANLRFMPECLCFMFHKISKRLSSMYSNQLSNQKMPIVYETHFLNQVVKPLYRVVAKMKHEESKIKNSKKPLDHKNITNYDDINEFFWNPDCLHFDEYNIASAFENREMKTFKERRSFFNPFLAFYRIYFFLLIMFHLLIVIAYVAYQSAPNSTDGFRVYSNFFSPEFTTMRKVSFYSIFVSYAFLSACKVVLQVWIDGILIFNRKRYALALFSRLVWHSVFFGVFSCITWSSKESFGPIGSFLDFAPLAIAIYGVPVVLAGMSNMFCSQFLWNNSFLNTLQGTKSQYVGRNTSQSWPSFIKYALFWLLLFGLKFLFNLQLMIKPIVVPSVEIYSLNVVQPQEGLVESRHNIAFLVALWLPMFLVYMYDTQIWLAIFQSIVGVYIGLCMKIGHSSRVTQFMAKLSLAPLYFDQKIVSRLARGALVDPTKATLDSPENQSRLRFAVVWNECISSFRLSDLIDDRESAILQYQISTSGFVDDPVFLLAGKATAACGLVSKQRRWTSANVIKILQSKKLLTVSSVCMKLLYRIMQRLLGPQDIAFAKVFHVLKHDESAINCVNMVHLSTLRENIVDLLACLLDLPDTSQNQEQGLGLHAIHDHVAVVIQRVDMLFKTLEVMLENESMVQCLKQSPFLNTSNNNLAHQTNLLVEFFNDGEDINKPVTDRESAYSASTAGGNNDITMSNCTHLFFLLTLDIANALPRCVEAQRRMSFFLNSLLMNIPQIDSIYSMRSFSVVTPYYNEAVLYSLEELNTRVDSNVLFRKVEAKGRDLSILKYLITLHPEEWGNFLERINSTSIDDALTQAPTQVRLWASLRGQTLARTVHGMMLYEDAIKMLRWLEIGSDQNMSHEEKICQMDHIVGLKFSYITSCQLYATQVASNDPRSLDIDLLMRKYPNWRVIFVEAVKDGQDPNAMKYECVLVKAEQDEIVEIYRYELPGNPIIGEGKPENQNIALPFTRGEFIQTIDMNQEHYFEECLKMPNFLATGQNMPLTSRPTIIGMKEYIFTAKASSLARFMTLQELVFVSLTQRVMADPLKTRMHYGHPDVFDKFFVMTSGGVSKASKGINLSEDVFSGYNCTLRGGNVVHVEFMQCGKGRDVTLSQINAFEAKLANGSAESSLSRESHRMGSSLDFFRLNAMYYSHMGFYISNFLTVVCVYAYVYSKLYVALHPQVEYEAIPKTSELDNLAEVMNTQFIFQFGMLMTIPLMATLVVEMGFRQACLYFLELIFTLGPVFYIFETGTKAHFFDVAMLRGGSKYRGTGRGFAITRDTFVSFFKEYAASHYRKALELMAVMALFGIYGTFDIGVNAYSDYCSVNDCVSKPGLIPVNVTLFNSYLNKGQSFGIASFAVWLLGISWVLAPFLFNTDGLDFSKTRMDTMYWFKWLLTPESEDLNNTPVNGWRQWWLSEADLGKDISWTSRVVCAIRECRHFLVLYYVFIQDFRLQDISLLLASVGGISVVLWISHLASNVCFKHKIRMVRSMLYLVFVIGISIGVVFVLGSMYKWTNRKCLSLLISTYAGLYALLQYFLICHGICNLKIARWGLVVELGFLFDSLLGFLILIPLVLLSAIPFMSTIQTRMMYNHGFSRALSTGGEFAASICMYTGVCGGFTFGYLTAVLFTLGYVNSVNDNFTNQSFTYWIDHAMTGKALQKAQLNVYISLAMIGGVILGCGISYLLGRRAGIFSGAVLTIGGVALVNVVDESLLVLIGLCLCGAGISMTALNCVLYNFEICTKDWTGKGVILFIFLSSVGYFTAAMIDYHINEISIVREWADKPSRDWKLCMLYGTIPNVLLVLFIFFLPESPVWLFLRRDSKSAEAVFVTLRQKHDVVDEMAEMEEFITPKDTVNLTFRLVLSVLLQVTYGFATSNGLFMRVLVKRGREDAREIASKWQIYFGLLSLLGTLIGLFTVDNVRRKTILKDILPLVGGLSILIGVLQKLNVSNTAIEIFVFVQYLTIALSLTSSVWLTSIEIFPPSSHMKFICISFIMYYATQLAVFVLLPDFFVLNLIVGVLCIILSAFLLLFCASTKFGAIQLKSEKKKEKKRLAALLQEELLQDQDGMYNSRSSRRSHSFLKNTNRRSSSRYLTKTPKEDFQAYNSPGAQLKKAA